MGLKQGENYELVPQEAWIKFVDIYSLYNKSEPIERLRVPNVHVSIVPPFICRKVIEDNGANGNEYIVDVYPLEVLVACYSPDQEELKEFSFPSNIEIGITSISDNICRSCMISIVSAVLARTLLEKYEVSCGRLWIRLKNGSHKPLQRSTGTRQLREYNVHQPCVCKNEMMHMQAQS